MAANSFVDPAGADSFGADKAVRQRIWAAL
jgi:hypothetical protein